jgi:hypothetical protein
VSDDFLSRLREEPRPEFRDGLEERLRAVDASERERRAMPGPWRRLAPALAGAGFVAAVALGFTLDPVRAAARDFLDLFRVKRFAAVPVDPQRLERLARGGVDLKTLVSEQVQVVVAPQKPVEVASPEAGAVEAGIVADVPTVLPRRAALVQTTLGRPGSFRVQVDTAKLGSLAAAAGADEIEIPAWWNGATVDVEMPPVLALRYARTFEATDTRPAREESFVLMQSANPQVVLPEGFDLSILGRLGLRLAGMSAQDALAFSRTIDWRATLLVPVPIQGGTFREVEVSGQKGLLVTVQPPPRTAAEGPARAAHSVVMWSAAGKVFALQGPATRDAVELLEMAQSVTDQSRGRTASE